MSGNGTCSSYNTAVLAKQQYAAIHVHLAMCAYAQVADGTSQSMLAAIDLLRGLRSNATAALPGLSATIGTFSLNTSGLDDALVINTTTVPVYNTYSGLPCVDYGRVHHVPKLSFHVRWFTLHACMHMLDKDNASCTADMQSSICSP